MLITTLIILAAISGLLAILAAEQKRRLTLYLFKPLTMVLIIVLAVVSSRQNSAFYKYVIIAGLCCSLVGDVYLMLPTDKFIHGLVSFLFAHILYIVGFAYGGNGALWWSAIIPFVLYGLMMLSILWPHLGKLRSPVILYMLVILAMGWLAASRWRLTAQVGSELAFLGALFFIASDSLLALDRFKRSFRGAQFLILSTYFTAQCLIALST